MTVTAPGSGTRQPDLLEAGPPRARRMRPAIALAALGVLVLGAAAVRGGIDEPPAPVPRATSTAGATAGITATASLAGAPTEQPYAQRLTFTVDLPATGRGGGVEAALVGVRLRGFTVQPDDPREVLPLGHFGSTERGRSTTVPATAVVVDCSIEPQARRDIELTVRTGAGADGAVRVLAESDVVRALDRLVGRTCRRPRG